MFLSESRPQEDDRRVLLPSPTEGVEVGRWEGRPTLSRKSGFTSLVALGCLGHREKLGWAGVGDPRP